MLSIVFPSKNTEAAQHCIASLQTNSSHLTEIIVLWNGDPQKKGSRVTTSIQAALEAPERWYDVQGMDVYAMFNLGAKLATGELVVFVNDDMYFPPKWDDCVVEFFRNSKEPSNEALMFSVVEPGIVEVNQLNIEKDFGRTLDTFDRKAFDAFATEVVSIKEGMGWLMPVVFHHTLFQQRGHYSTIEKFPYPNDVYYFDYLIKSGVRMFVSTQKIYHFQRLSQRSVKVEHEKLHLCCGPEHFDGYLNCDISGSDMDIDLSAGVIPFVEDSFTEIIMKHGLEHFRASIAFDLLKECARILKKGGKFHVFVPDLMLAVQDFQLGYNQHENCAPAMLRIYGQNTSEPLVHKWGYTKDSLKSLLLEAGFSKVAVANRGVIDEIYLIAEK